MFCSHARRAALPPTFLRSASFSSRMRSSRESSHRLSDDRRAVLGRAASGMRRILASLACGGTSRSSMIARQGAAPWVSTRLCSSGGPSHRTARRGRAHRLVSKSGWRSPRDRPRCCPRIAPRERSTPLPEREDSTATGAGSRETDGVQALSQLPPFLVEVVEACAQAAVAGPPPRFQMARLCPTVVRSETSTARKTSPTH